MKPFSALGRLEMKRTQTVGVIGAGIAGLACARRLHSAGLDVTVLEKSRGVGGRAATRRMNSGATFDHGAQYFTVRDEIFVKQTNEWCARGIVSVWRGQIVTIDQGIVTELREPRNRYVGVPGMNAIAKSLAAELKVRTNVTAQSLRRFEGKWQIADAAGTLHGPFDLVVSTAPPPQTMAILGGVSSTLARPLANVKMAPCWAVMLQTRDLMRLPFDAAFVHNSPLSWIARNSSKPARDATDCWILHASAKWSRDHLEESADTVAGHLLEEFWQTTQQAAKPIHFVTAHRWRYASPEEPLSQRFLLDRNQNLGACGDWCGGPRVEGAFLSGLAMAETALGPS